MSDCIALPETLLESEARGRRKQAGPGQQVNRAYEGGFQKMEKFGRPTPIDKLGGGVRDVMTWKVCQ